MLLDYLALALLIVVIVLVFYGVIAVQRGHPHRDAIEVTPVFTTVSGRIGVRALVAAVARGPLYTPLRLASRAEACA